MEDNAINNAATNANFFTVGKQPADYVEADVDVLYAAQKCFT